MKLQILPVRTGGAAENMALDFLLLQRNHPPADARFRHYDWRSPAATFGYAQKIAFVRAQLPTDVPLDLCRRPTGGGIVDHRSDWTYSLIIPRGHPLEEVPATQSYQAVHQAIADALRRQEVAAVTKKGAEDLGETGPGICFQRAEVFDVVHETTGQKLAGAAQKRNKRGLLFQGSISRPAVEVSGAIDWDRFHDDFVAGMEKALGISAETEPWPELDEDEVTSLTEQYSSPEWLEYR